MAFPQNDPIQAAQIQQQGLNLPNQPPDIDWSTFNAVGKPAAKVPAPQTAIAAQPSAQPSQPDIDWSTFQPVVQQPAEEQPKSVWENLKDVFVGPTTAAGQPLPQAAKTEASGIEDITQGNFKQGLGKVWDSERPHIISGSPMEKAIRFFNPDFHGAAVPVERATSFPMVDVSQFVDKQEHPVAKAVAETLQGFTSPESVAIMVSTGGLGLVESPKALAIANKLISAGFSASSIGTAYKHLESFKNAYDAGDQNEALYQLTSAVLNGTVSAVAGAHAAGIELPAASPMDKAIAKKVAGGIADAAGAVAGVGPAIAEKARSMAGIKPETLESVTGKIAQAEPGEIPTAQRGLAAVDTTGAETYGDLKQILDQKVRKNTAAVDATLETSPVKLTVGDTETTTPVQGRPALVSNHVADALDQLADFYHKTNNQPDLARILNAQAKFEKGGLSLREINDIAREHGTELNSFNASGELASGLSKQAAENTRVGVKEIVRRAMPDDQTRQLDSETSDVIKTRDMIDDMATKVQKVQNKLESAGLLDKVGTWTGKAIDIVTGGLLKHVLHQVIGLGGDPQSLNAADIEKNLSDNLATFDRLGKMSPQLAAQQLNTILNQSGGPGVIPPKAVPASDPNATAGAIKDTGSLRRGPLPEASPEIAQAMQGTGLEFIGTDSMGLSHFHDPRTNNTLSIPTEKVTQDVLLTKLAEKAAQAAKNPNVPYIASNPQVAMAKKNFIKTLLKYNDAKKEMSAAGSPPNKLKAQTKMREAAQNSIDAQDEYAQIHRAWKQTQLTSRVASDKEYADTFKPMIAGDVPHNEIPESTASPVRETMTHEYGHAALESLFPALAKKGVKVVEIQASSHPGLASSPGTMAAAKIDYGELTRPDGTISLDEVRQHLSDLLQMAAMGGANEELLHGTKIRDNEGLTGDIQYMKHYMNALDIPEETQKMMIDRSFELAKEKLKTPGVLGAIEKYSYGREAGLTDENLHASRARIQTMNDEIKSILENPNAGNSSRTTGQGGAGNKTAQPGAENKAAGTVPPANVKRTGAVGEKDKNDYFVRSIGGSLKAIELRQQISDLGDRMPLEKARLQAQLAEQEKANQSRDEEKTGQTATNSGIIKSLGVATGIGALAGTVQNRKVKK
jgi:hypothetical protein